MFVLNSQRLSAARDRIRADLEYQINFKAQTDVTNLARKIDRIEALLAGNAAGDGQPNPPGGQKGGPPR